MDPAELEKYEYQLAQIDQALAADPTNQEFVTLKEELTSLIQLTREYLGVKAPAPKSAAPGPRASTSAGSAKPSASTAASSQSSAPAASSPRGPVHVFKAGDDCLARYSADRKFYPARVVSVAGSDTNRVYSVIFSGYSSTELVTQDDVKLLEDKKHKRTAELSEAEQEKERKRKKQEKKDETKAAKTAEQANKQQSWQKFAKKSAKKGVVIPGISGQSMFRSPDDGKPQAKVGVTGSGKGMTAAPERRRQTFE